jgi:hypothetical protein
MLKNMHPSISIKLKNIKRTCFHDMLDISISRVNVVPYLETQLFEHLFNLKSINFCSLSSRLTRIIFSMIEDNCLAPILVAHVIKLQMNGQVWHDRQIREVIINLRTIVRVIAVISTNTTFFQQPGIIDRHTLENQQHIQYKKC